MARIDELATSQDDVVRAATEDCEDSLQLGSLSLTDADKASGKTDYVGLLCLPDELILIVLELVLGPFPREPWQTPSLVSIWKQELPQFFINKRVYQLAQRAIIPRGFHLPLSLHPMGNVDTWTFVQVQAWLAKHRSYLGHVREAQLSVQNPRNLNMRTRHVERFLQDMVQLEDLSVYGWPVGLPNEHAFDGLSPTLRILVLDSMRMPIDVLRSILLQFPHLLQMTCRRISAFNSDPEQQGMYYSQRPVLPVLPYAGSGAGGVMPLSPVFSILSWSCCNFAPNRILDFAYPLSTLGLLELSPDISSLRPNIRHFLPPGLRQLCLGLNAGNARPDRFQTWFDATIDKVGPRDLPHLEALVLYDDVPIMLTTRAPVMGPFFGSFPHIRSIEITLMTYSFLSVSMLNGLSQFLLYHAHHKLKRCIIHFGSEEPTSEFIWGVWLHLLDRTFAHCNFALEATTRRDGGSARVSIRSQYWRLIEEEEAN